MRGENAGVAGDIIKCQLKPIQPSDYTASFTAEEMARLTADLARIDTDLAAAAAANDSKKLESLGRARAKTQADLDAAETAWIAAEEALAEVA